MFAALIVVRSSIRWTSPAPTAVVGSGTTFWKGSAMGMYFALCAQDDMKPSVAGMALAFGVDRKTIWAWANGVDSKTLPAESRNLIKKAYQLLNAQMESYMQNGKINPVAGIFLMKNNMGYADKQEVVLTPNQQLGDQVPAEDLEKKYLEDVAGASSDYDSED